MRTIHELLIEFQLESYKLATSDFLEVNEKIKQLKEIRFQLEKEIEERIKSK